MVWLGASMMILVMLVSGVAGGSNSPVCSASLNSVTTFFGSPFIALMTNARTTASALETLRRFAALSQ